MAQQIKLNEEQMREFVEQEVRKALNESIEENMTDEGILNWLQNLIGGAAGQQGGQMMPQGKGGVSMEGIIGAILGRFFAPVLRKLLDKIGIPADGPVGKVIINAASTMGGYGLGQLLDKKYDFLGLDNLVAGRQPQTGAQE